MFFFLFLGKPDSKNWFLSTEDKNEIPNKFGLMLQASKASSNSDLFYESSDRGPDKSTILHAILITH